MGRNRIRCSCSDPPDQSEQDEHKQKYVRGKRYFEKDARWPDGIDIHVPGWFVLIVGIPTLIFILGGIEKILSGLGLRSLTKDERSAMAWWEPIFGVFGIGLGAAMRAGEGYEYSAETGIAKKTTILSDADKKKLFAKWRREHPELFDEEGNPTGDLVFGE